MPSEQSYVQRLENLERPEFEREVRRRIAEALQGLVACIEHAAVERGQLLSSCAIDDFRVVQTDVRPAECRVVLRYQSSAKDKATGSLERISGSGEAIIDERGEVTYRGITFAEAQEFVAPDVGVGD